VPSDPPRRPPETHPRPADRERVSCLVQGAVLSALLVVFLAFVAWVVLTGS